jgi:hypothetical protein
MVLDFFNLITDTNPYIVFLLEISMISLVLGLTKPSSITRPAVLPFIAGCAYSLVVNSIKYLRPRAPWAALLGAQGPIFLLLYVEMALLSKWDFEARGPSSRLPRPREGTNSAVQGSKTSFDGEERPIPRIEITHSGREGTTRERLCFGFNSTISFRDVNKPFEVKNVPYFSEKDHNYAPLRANFLTWTALRFVACYLVLDLIESQPAPPNADEIFALSSVPVFRRLSEVSIEEIFIRTIGSFSFWVMIYALLHCLYAFSAFVAVGSGLSDAREWRPFMGSISEAYTIRGFWGKNTSRFCSRMND